MSAIKRTKKTIKKKEGVHPRDLDQKHQREERKQLTNYRVHLYANALRIPPAINQFNQYLEESDSKEFLDLFRKYVPETKKQKKERLEKENPKEGPKPILNKFGSKHVVSLIEEKKAKLVLIASDVDPIEQVVFLPTLCKKMGVPYAIINSKAALGALVNLKQTACVCLCDISSSDKDTFNKLISKANSIYADNYEMTMKKWGGGVLLRNKEENK